MSLWQIVHTAKKRNITITGMVGTGKDVLLGNILARLKKPYVSNFDYGGTRYPLNMKCFDMGGNTFRNFLEDDILYYKYPYDDGTLVAISDLGVYMPSQYCHQLDKDYGYFATFMALVRQMGSRVFFNVQCLERAWNKVREMCEVYYRCTGCKVVFGKIVFMTVIEYDKFESCVSRVPPFPLSRPFLNPNRQLQYDLAKCNYLISHGKVKKHFLIFWNKSKHDTRVFKSMLEGGRLPDDSIH